MTKGSITLRCALLGLSRDTYYAFPNRRAMRMGKDKPLTETLRVIAKKKRYKLGIKALTMAYNRIHADNPINHKRVERLKREYHIPTTIRTRRYKKPAQPKPTEHMVIAENIVSRNFTVTTPLRLAGTDITYLWIPRLRRFVYLSNVRDMATGEYLGWEVSFSNDQTLADATILDVERTHGVRMFKKLTLHMDRGGTYTAKHYQHTILKGRGVTPSMSRKGNCIDNAPTESGHGHLKDWLDLSSCVTLDDVRREVDSVIHYFNEERPQWHRKKMTPVEYRGHLLATAT